MFLETIRKVALQKTLIDKIYRWKETMFRLQVWITKAVNRRRRKKEIMYIYWELITERLKHMFAKFGPSALKKYGGTNILYAMESSKRKKIVYEYIVKIERDYID